PPERIDTPCREIPLSSRSVSLMPSTILQANLHEGARRMLAQLIAEADCFVAIWKDLKLPDGPRRASCLSAPSCDPDRGLGLSRSVAPRYATVARWARRRKSASRRRSFRSGRGGRRVLMLCCR